MYDHAKSTKFLFTKVGAKAIIIRSFPEPVEAIRPEHDGFLIEAEPDQKVELELVVTVPKNRNITGIIVRSFKEDKPIIVKKNQADKAKTYRMFRKTVGSRLTQDETLSTKHDVNNIRLVVAEGGIFQMWEIAVPTRIVGPVANFFLTIQKLYQAGMYNLNGQIYMPEHEYDGYQKWNSLRALLGNMVKIETLPKINKPFTAQPMPPSANGTHKVMFFCLASGTGMAQTSQGPAFIHWKELPRQDRFACATEGQLIHGDIINSNKGFRLTNIKTLD
ncbi:MAG: hypothetical protein HYX20_01700 [Candidatus Yanofskybacteria bacterium]|nr:hypothetical protein [Candidatus Yanofskybacteria bacterium]